jgi:mono/diheme cytochrome c family protein
MDHMKLGIRIAIACTLITAVSLVFGCGEKGETNVPAVKLTSSTVTSQTVSAHTHTVTIPFTDISAAPVADLQYRSSVSSGHSHVIALSKQQIIDLNNGMRLSLTSSVPDSVVSVSHTHTWDIQGGTVLYDRSCYNCHSNDKRGNSPMNVSFNESQTKAVVNPGSAPLSTTSPATPDPAFIPSGSVSLDGAALYAANCVGGSCHGSLINSTKANKTASQIQGAIDSNQGGMSSLGGLTPAQVQAIAAALVK